MHETNFVLSEEGARFPSATLMIKVLSATTCRRARTTYVPHRHRQRKDLNRTSLSNHVRSRPFKPLGRKVLLKKGVSILQEDIYQILR